MRTTIFTGGTLVELSPPSVRQADLVISDGAVTADPRIPTTATVDARGCVIMPGLVLAHTHLYSALAPGMPAPAVPPDSFRQILERVWWRLDRALDRQSLRASARVAALALARAGVSTVIDHHESPGFIGGALDVLAEALEEVGLRGALAYGATDRHGAEGARAGLEESRRFAQARRADPRIRGMIGLHAPFTCTDQTLARAAALAQETGSFLHLHAAEGPDDGQAASERWGQPLLAGLARLGLLGERTLLAHLVHLEEEDRALLVESGATVTHQARSNMNNGVGYARALVGLPRVALGTDGVDQDVLAELGAAFFRRREALGPAVWPDPLALLAGGQALAARIFERPLGRFSAGAPADLVILDYDPPTPLEAHDLGAHLLFGGLTSARVRDLYVDGRPVLRNRRVVGVDEQAWLAEARAEAPRLWSRMAALG